jgi:spore maturation protein CgeB
MIGKFEKELLNLVEFYRPDMLLTIKGEILRGEFLRLIKKNFRMPVVNWFADPINQLFNPPYILIDALKEYDYFFVKDEYFLKQVRLLSPDNTHMLHSGYDQHTFMPSSEDPSFRYDLSLVGSYYQNRVAVLAGIASHGLAIFGNGWGKLPKSHPLTGCWMKKPVYEKELIDVFCSSRINLNIQHPLEVFGVNHRAFEIAGCGGFQIMDNALGIHDYFDVDKEIVVFSNIYELKEKVEYYLEHPQERREISQRAQKKARENHTTEIQFNKMLGIMNIS